AKELLRRLIFLNGENLEAMAQAAELMERKELRQEAAEYRLDLFHRMPWGLENRSLLSEDLMKLNRKSEAETHATAVLSSGRSAVEDLTRAAKVLGTVSAKAVGPREMRLIEAAVRGEAGAAQDATQPYAHALRTVL